MVFAHSHISSSHSSPSHRSAITDNNKHILVSGWCIMQMRPIPIGTVFYASFYLLIIIVGVVFLMGLWPLGHGEVFFFFLSGSFGGFSTFGSSQSRNAAEYWELQ